MTKSSGIDRAGLGTAKRTECPIVSWQTSDQVRQIKQEEKRKAKTDIKLKILVWKLWTLY